MQKIKKHRCGFISSQNGMGQDDSDTKKKKKNYRSNSFQPIWNREFPKNSKKMQKFEKHHYGFISSQNGTGQAENDTKKMLLFRSIPTRPGIGNSRKIAKKLKKLK